MTIEEVDTLLQRALQHDRVVIDPDPMFAEEVMKRVGQELQRPLPIAFPWKRALPGMFASGIIAGLLAYWLLAGIHRVYVAPAESLPSEQAVMFQHAVVPTICTLLLEGILLTACDFVLLPSSVRLRAHFR